MVVPSHGVQDVGSWLSVSQRFRNERSEDPSVTSSVSPARAASPRTATSVIDAAGTCLLCSAPTVESLACCSLYCAEQAQREFRWNVDLLERLGHDDSTAPERRRLAERNGRLSSALLRFRPIHEVTSAA